MLTTFWEQKTASSFTGSETYDPADIGRENQLAEAQTTGALDALGAGVYGGATSFAVAAATGAGNALKVQIQPGTAIARHSAFGPCALQTAAAILRAMPASSTLNLFAVYERGVVNDSRVSKAPQFLTTTAEILDGGEWLATVTTSATAIISVVDHRNLKSSSGGAADGAQLAGLFKAGPASGAAANPTYRAITGTDLPDATTTTKGAILFAADGSTTAGRAPLATDSRLNNARPPTAHTHPATQISDSTATGRAVLSATDAAAARSALSAPSVADLTASAALMLRRDGSTPLTAAWDVGGQRLTNGALPTINGDLVTKEYADALAQGIKFKDAVTAASTANIGTLSGLLTLDGVVLQAGNRVLVKDQATAAQNGIYVVDASAWSRAADADGAGELDAGTQTYVQFGAAQGKTAWTLLTASVTPGTTAQQWVQSASSGGGEANTGTNQGIGSGLLFKAKSGLTLLFRSLLAGSNKISITSGADEITLDVVEANLALDNLGGTLSAAKVGASATSVVSGIPKAGSDGKIDSSWFPAILNSRDTVSVTTAALADAAIENVTIVVAKAADLFQVSTSAAAEIRLYSTSAARTADAARAATAIPDAGNGLLYQGTTTSGLLSLPVDRAVLLYNLDAPPNSSIYASIKNVSGAAAAVTVSLTILRAEN